MKKSTIVCLIVAGSLILTGAVISFVGFATVGFNPKKLSTFTGYETKNIEVDNNYDSIYIDEDSNDVTVGISLDNKIHVTYSENDVEDVTLVNKNNKLSISRNSYTTFFNPWYIPTEDKIMDIKLPVGYLGRVEIETSNGSFYIDKISTSYLNTSTSNGLITLTDCIINTYLGESSNNAIIIKDSIISKANVGSSNGKIEVENSTFHTIDASTSNGQIELSNSSFTGDSSFVTSNSSITATSIKAITSDLKLESSNGKIEINESKFKSIAAETSNAPLTISNLQASSSINLSTSNNSITGTIKGSMDDFMIYSETSNGSNTLPTNKTDGEKTLKASTSNGNIDISFIK